MKNWPTSRRPINFSANPLVLVWPLYRGDARQGLQWVNVGIPTFVRWSVRPAPPSISTAHHVRRVSQSPQDGPARAGAKRFGWQYAGFWTKASNFRIVDRDQMKIVATGDCGFRVIN